jgi:hypothetical protein
MVHTCWSTWSAATVTAVSLKSTAMVPTAVEAAAWAAVKTAHVFGNSRRRCPGEGYACDSCTKSFQRGGFSHFSIPST